MREERSDLLAGLFGRDIVSVSHGDVRLEHEIVFVAVTPRFSGFKGEYDGVVSCMKVFGRVLVLRIIATANVSALHADAKMFPGIPGFKAFHAAVSGWSDIVKVLNVRALIAHKHPL